jgi:arylsulfatase
MPNSRKRSLLKLLLASVAVLAPISAPRPGCAAEAVSAAPRGGVARAPNVLIWMMDDVGFGQISAFGGLIDTPNIDRVARMGLRYANYHSAPICSASRAALLTGRNPHSVHIGAHAAAPNPLPGHDGLIPASAGGLAANLRAAGYQTFALGKWDHLPSRDVTPAGPFTYWPSGQGFDRFYGFLGADADQFRPVLWDDHTPLEAPRRADYHLSADLADHAISWISATRDGADRRPFFLYWATGAVHAPHQAPAAYLARYRGRFDRGWDWARGEILARQKALGLVAMDVTLPARPEGMPAWDSLPPDARTSYARAMEAFAAQLTHADAEFGRILDALERSGELANTIVVVTSDNGASAEGAHHGTFNESLYIQGHYPTVAENLAHQDAWGGPATYPNYPMGWAVAGDTPFRYYKQTTYEGGVRVPLVIAWPRGMKSAGGVVRDRFAYVTDLAPTILDAAGVAPAKEIDGVAQSPFEGLSLAATFQDRRAPAPPGRVQYVELWGDRAVYKGRWKAVAAERLETWRQGGEPPISDNSWELYDLAKDPNEQTNLAARDPGRLAEMKADFEREARRHNALPFTTQSASRQYGAARAAKSFAAHGGVWRYTAPVARTPEALMPPILARSFRMTARFEAPAGANGVVFAAGGRFGGLSLYLLQGRPVFAYRGADLRLTRIAATRALKSGEAVLRLEVSRSGDHAAVRIFDGDAEIAAGELLGPLARTFSLTEPFGVGSDSGYSPVEDYDTPNPLQGRIQEVVFDFNFGSSEPSPKS